MELFKMFGSIVIDDKDANSKIDGVVGTAKGAEGKMGSSFGKIGKAVAGAFTVGAIVNFEKSVIQTYSTYDDQMRKVQAVTGATGEEYEKLKNMAEDLGRTTRFSATEAGEGMEVLARAGLTTNEVLAVTPTQLNFATANAIKMSNAGEILTSTMNQFNLTAEDSGKISDILSETSRAASTDVELLGESFKYVGPVAGALGYKLEDTSVALGLMAKQSIVGGQAGTALKNILANMAKPTDDVAFAMQELGVEMTNSKGEMLPLKDVIGDLRGGFANLTEAEKVQYATMIAGKQGMSALLAIVNASEEDFNEMTEAIENSTGATDEMREIMDSGMGGALAGVSSAWEGVQIAMGKVQEGAIVDFLNLLAEALQAIPGIIEKVNEKWKEFKQMLADNSYEIQVFWIKTQFVLYELWQFVQQVFEGIWEIIKGFWDKNGDTLKVMFDMIMNIVKTGMDLIKNIIDFVLALISGDWEGAWSALGEILSNIWEMMKNMLGIALNAMAMVITNGLEIIKGLWSVVWELIKNVLTVIWEGIKSVVSAGIDWIGNLFSTVFTPIADFFISIWEAMKTAVAFVWEAIKAIVEGAILIIQTVIQMYLNIIKAIWDAIWGAIGDTVKMIWNGIKNVITTILKAIQSVISSIMKAIQTVITNIWNNVKTTTTNIWNSIKGVLTNVLNAIKGVFTNIFNAIKGVVTNVWNNIKSVTTSIWNSIKGVITNIVNAIKGVITNVFNSIKGVVSNAWNGVMGVTSNIWNNIKNTIANIVNSIKTVVTNVFNSIKGVASSVWNGVKTAMTTPVEAAKNTISNILDTIKGFFSSLKLKFPKIEMPPLPHFSLTGEFSLKPPSVPRLSVDWYKDGGILTDATIFGASGGKLLGGGEAGPEAVLPIAKLGGIMADTMDQLGYSGNNPGARVEQNVYITSPKPLSPSEIARENKKALQRLGLEF